MDQVDTYRWRPCAGADRRGTNGGRFGEIATIACRLAAYDDIAAVHIAAPDRPSFADLAALRRMAGLSGVAVAVRAGEVVLRAPRELTPRPAPRPGAGRWLDRHLGPWVADLRSMSEGTR